MSRIMGLREFWLAQLRLPGDIQKQAAEDPFVAALAESIRRVGLVQPPLIWIMSTKRKLPLDGRARIAALIKLGIPNFKGVAIEATPEEAYQMYVEAHQWRARMEPEDLRVHAEPLRSLQPYKLPPPEVTAGLQRPKAAEKNLARAQVPDPALAINELGMEVTGDFREALTKVNVELHRIVYYLSCAVAGLDRIAKKRWPMNALTRQLLRDRTADLRDQVVPQLPHSICPWCKGIDAIACEGCHGSRWVGKAQFDAALPKFKDPKDQIVAIDGTVRRLSEIMETTYG